MNKTLEIVEAVHTTHILRDKKGISLIALVITIIVVIILAAIAFNSSTSTIGKANYSKFVTNISEVQSAIRQKMITVKGTMMAKGTEVTDGQIYNYIAKGGTSESDILVESRVPDYTVIEKKADIGIKLLTMKVNTPTQTGVEAKYAVTDDGVVFIWPPFPHEEKYYVTETETVDEDVVSSSGETEIKVADKVLKVELNEEGEIQTKEILYDGLTKKEFEEIKEKVKVGDYVNYSLSESEKVTIETDPNKTGYTTKETLTTDTTAKWRILSIDNDTGKVLITTQGPVNKVTLRGATGYLFGANELHRLCEKLYSNTSKSLVAKSMTIEDLNKACNYSLSVYLTRYAWYLPDTEEIQMKKVEIGNKIYFPLNHTANMKNNVLFPRFYTWDDANGITQTSDNENAYVELKPNDGPILTTKTMYSYNPSEKNLLVADILDGDDNNRGWLASQTLYLDAEEYDARFGISSAYSELVHTRDLYYSEGVTFTYKLGLRPVVSFNISRLNISDTTKTGAESAPWEIK